ncbi:MAG: choice-of-anchor D domain-containing protein, partial [Terriglobales bacterium]
FTVEGADQLVSSPQGGLVMNVAGERLALDAPNLYQLASGKRLPVAGRFVVRGSQVGFDVGAYRRDLRLVIDPVLSYASVLGGSGPTDVAGLAVDSAGNAFITGFTSATDFPVAGGLQPTLAGRSDVLISKVSADGTHLIYSTFLGGTSNDEGHAIAIDGAGNAYITGTTGSADFPTTANAFLRSCPGGCNAPFAARLRPDGSLDYSTLLGPSNANANAIAADGSGNAYVTGTVASSDLPVVNAFQSAFAGTAGAGVADAFVQKLNATGSGFVFSTYLGSGTSIGRGIAVDPSGNVVVVGSTTSAQFPTKAALQPGLGASFSSYSQGFVSKLSADGSRLIFSTYVAGTTVTTGTDLNAVALDGAGNIDVVGTTVSPDFPLTLDALQSGCGAIGGTCLPQAVLLQFSSDGSRLNYGTLLGTGTASAVAVQGANVVVVGATGSAAFPTVHALQTNLQQSPNYGGNAFVTVMQPPAAPAFSTFLGGKGTNGQAVGVGTDAGGNIYLAGITAGSGADFPVVRPLLPDLVCCSGDTLCVAKISPSDGPALSISPRIAPFVILRNVATAPLSLQGITATSFTVGTDCGPTLAGGDDCTVTLQNLDASPSGTLTVASNDPGGPQAVTIRKALNGDLIGAVIRASANSLRFAPRQVGVSSPPQTVTVRNIGMQTGAVTNVRTTGDFSQTNSCGSLPPEASCAIQVTYTPSSATVSAASLSIDTDSSTIQIDIFLGSTGTASSLFLVATQMSFGDQFVGVNGFARLVTLTNVSGAPVSLGSPTVTGTFAVNDQCPAILAPDASCRMAVTFVPLANGSQVGTLTIPHSGAGSPEQVTLRGVGHIVSDLGIAPLNLDFGSPYLGTPTAPQTVTLTNVRATALPLGPFATSGDFSQTNQCPASLAPAATCAVNVVFTATAVGDRTGTLSLAHSGVGSPQLVPLHGIGAPALSILPDIHDFEDQLVGTSSLPITFTATNNSQQLALTLMPPLVTGDFSLGQNSCSGSLAPKGTCGAQVTFVPRATGSSSGTLSLTASDTGAPHTVILKGRGVGSGIVSLSTSILNFAAQAKNTVSPPQTVTVTNTGSGTLNVASIGTGGTNFAATNNCPASMAAAATCTVSVTFVPSTAGARTGVVKIDDDAAKSPHLIYLSGTGVGSPAVLLPPRADFPGQVLGSSSAPQTVTLQNSGDASLTIKSESVTGDFSLVTPDCVGSVYPGGTCHLILTFTPTTVGTRMGTVTVTDDAAGSPHTLSVSGQGTDVAVAAASGSSLSATINSGATATYQVAVTPINGLTGTLQFSCSGAPVLAACTVNGKPVALNGVDPVVTTVTVTTTAHGVTLPWPFHPDSRPRLGSWLLALLALLAMLWRAGRRPRWAAVALFGASIWMVGCGGGSGGNIGLPPGSPGTPAGTYSLKLNVVVATATNPAGVMRTATLTLTVN